MEGKVPPVTPTPAVDAAAPPQAVDRMINVNEAAAMLGVSVPTMRKWRDTRAAGRPHGVKIGRSVRYSTVRLRSWLDQQIADSGSEV